jgi:hypothetical protein
MVNLLNDSNFHRQTAVMTPLIEMIIQNPVFGISCIISMLVHSTSQCLTSFTNIQKSIECTCYVVNDIFSLFKTFGKINNMLSLLVIIVIKYFCFHNVLAYRVHPFPV